MDINILQSWIKFKFLDMPINSLNDWTKHAGGWGLTCPECNGRRTYMNGEVCGCWVGEWADGVVREINSYRHPVQPRHLHDMVITQYNKEAVTQAMNFIHNPSFWFTLLGQPGCGKTHILSSINTALSPLALYICANSAFETQFFRALEKGYLGDFVDTLSSAPILLLDDYGAGYNRSDLVLAKVREIIDFRYRQPEKYPTVIATNIPLSEIEKNDPRVSSRLGDKAIVKSLVIGRGEMDYRKRSANER